MRHLTDNKGINNIISAEINETGLPNELEIFERAKIMLESNNIYVSKGLVNGAIGGVYDKDISSIEI